jgi:xanthine dehydrogenase YagS FAD-binding subunit
MNRFVLVDCTTVDGALSQLNDGAVVKAGGVDLLDRMKNGTSTPSRLVNIRNISELRGIHPTPQGMTIGALTTLTEISGHPLLQSQYTILSDACGSAATPHIRNMATLGGNLLQELQCWYFRSDEYQCLRKGKEICFAFAGLNQYHAIMDYGTCPAVAPSSAAVALLGLNASVELTSARRGKRTVAIQDLYVHPDANPTKLNVLEPDELLTAVTIPQPAPGTRSAYQKYGEKRSNDWPSPTQAWCWRWRATSAARPPSRWVRLRQLCGGRRRPKPCWWANPLPRRPRALRERRPCRARYPRPPCRAPSRFP